MLRNYFHLLSHSLFTKKEKIMKYLHIYSLRLMKNVLIIFLFPLSCLAQPKEIWINQPKEQWPFIALTNNVVYKNGDSYIDPSFQYAGTGFLIDYGKDTLAATAKHILWIAKNRKTTGVEINGDLKSWIMKPKGNRNDSAVIDKLINEEPSEKIEGNTSSIVERDWIVFSVKKASRNIYPLKPRTSEIKSGEKVYILSAAYEDSTTRITEGKILRKLGMDILIERLSQGPTPGSSGSPVIDANGHLIGVISSSSSDTESGKDVQVAISTEYLHKVIRKESNINTSKKDYGELIWKLVLTGGTKLAIKQYKQLIADPKNYYLYNLRGGNGLAKIGEKLMAMNRLKEAIEILEFNLKTNGSFYQYHNLLAKAYLISGNKKEAVKNYQLSMKQLNDKEENEAFKQLQKLRELK